MRVRLNWQDISRRSIIDINQAEFRQTKDQLIMTSPTTDQSNTDSGDSKTQPASLSDNSKIKNTAANVKYALNGRSVVFVGIMGVGKSTIGRRVARLLNIAFVDADAEIEQAADLSIAEIFEKFGEPYFRTGERKVITRVLGDGQQLLATGGGAFMDPETRKSIADNAVSVWLDADIDLVMQRVSRRKTRPLLQNPNPRKIIEDLMAARNPVYAEADCRFVSHDVSRDIIAAEIIDLLNEQLVLSSGSKELK